MGNVKILVRFQKGLGEADYVYVLLEKEVGEFWFLVMNALGVPGGDCEVLEGTRH